MSLSDQTALKDIPSLGPSVGELTAVEGGLQFAFKNPSYSNAAAVIATRKGSGVTYASNAELVPNSVTLAMINATTTTAWIAEVTASWQSQGDAILQGSVAKGNRTRAEGGSGTGETGGSSTGGHTADSMINTINGKNQPLTIDKVGTTIVTIEGNKLSSNIPVAGGTGILVNGWNLNDDATTAKFNIVVSENYTPGAVSYMGKTVAYVSKAGSGEDF